VHAQSPVLYPATDATKDIEAAIAAARKDGKHVLLDFGADWCPDCRVLGALFEEKEVSAVAAGNFHIVRIDVGRRDKNGDVAAKYHATSGEWIPALVVLAPDGSTVAVTDERVRVTRRTTAVELTKLLQDWAPKSRDCELATFTEHGVRVSVGLDRDRSGGLWLSGSFAPVTADTHLYATSLPAEGIQGLGRPTRLAIAAGSHLRSVGPPVADRPVLSDRIEGIGAVLPVYPPGPVTVRIPVVLDRAPDPRAEVLVSYMACGARGCLAPVTDRRVSFAVPR
jgi:thiol-disulfide isomerase/thioredoxin